MVIIVIIVIENQQNGIENQLNIKNHVDIKRIVISNIIVFIYMMEIIKLKMMKQKVNLNVNQDHKDYIMSIKKVIINVKKEFMLKVPWK